MFRLSHCFALVLLLGTFAGPTFAAEQPARQSLSTEELREREARAERYIALRSDLREVQDQLSAIQKQAIAESSVVLVEQQALQSAIVAAMRAQDYDPLAAIERMQKWRAVVMDPEVPPAEKHEPAAKHDAEAERFEEVREQAMADPAVQKQQKALEDALYEAMVEVDPETPQLIKRAKALQAELESFQPTTQQ